MEAVEKKVVSNKAGVENSGSKYKAVVLMKD